MNTFTFTLRVMRRYKGWFGLAGLLLLGVTAVMAALPLAADGLIAQSYAQSLTQANVAGRNLQVFTSSSAIDVERYQLVPELVQESVEVREILAPIDDANGLSGLKLWSFTGLDTAVTLIDGRLPTITDGNIEAAIGQEAAARTGLSAGNIISSGRHEITITGIIAPQDVRDDIWFGDLSPFDLIVTPQEEEHLVTLSLLIQPETMRSAFPAFTKSWRLLLNQDALVEQVSGSVETATSFRHALTQLQGELLPEFTRLETELPTILRPLEQSAQMARQAFTLLAGQWGVIALAVLWLASRMMIQKIGDELHQLAARGWSVRQLTAVFALAFGVFTLVATIASPVIARAGVAFWAAQAEVPVTVQITAISMSFAAGTAVTGWLICMLPFILFVRNGRLATPPWWGGAESRPGWQRWFLDVTLLALSGLATWQLWRSASDLGLYLSFFGLLIAILLLLLRIMPWLLRSVGWVARSRLRSAATPFSLTRMGRLPQHTITVIFFVAIPVAILLLTNTMRDTLAARQDELAHYAAGADMRVSLAGLTVAELAENRCEDVSECGSTAVTVQQLARANGVTTSTSLLRGSLQTDESNQSTTVLALEPDTFNQVARFPAGISSLTIANVMGALGAADADGVIPAVFSSAAVPQGLTVGDHVSFAVPGRLRRQVTFEIRGIITNFPTVDGRFLITNLSALQTAVPPGRFDLLGSNELWLELESGAEAELLRQGNGRLLASQHDALAAIQAAPLTQAVEAAFVWNGRVLTAIGSIAFLMMAFMAGQRHYENKLWMTIGLSRREQRYMQLSESVMILLGGLVLGTAVAVGLAYLLTPFLALALSGVG